MMPRAGSPNCNADWSDVSLADAQVLLLRIC
jgi:hypothetical protein